MSNHIKKMETQFINYIKRIQSYKEALLLMEWDMRTISPGNGINHRSNVIGDISENIFELSTSPTMKELINELSKYMEGNKMSNFTKSLLKYMKKEYNLNSKISLNDFKNYAILKSNAENKWIEAKEKSDFKLFSPYLEETIKFKKSCIDKWDYNDPYDAMIDVFEPDMTTSIIDPLFNKLKQTIIPLLKRNRNLIKKDNLNIYVNKKEQKEFIVGTLQQIGYNFNAGRLDESAHPFPGRMNPHDVRITTRYNVYDFTDAFFSTIHEAGHAIYLQNISKDLIGTPLSYATSSGMDESISQFWEKIVGFNKPFWKYQYPKLKSNIKKYNDVPLEHFLEHINAVNCSPVRIGSDELTYLLHIILRYEIEKEIFNNDIKVSDIPEIWNNKIYEYLGVTPENDAEGVLQDIHWAWGEFGYFPTYALGLIYASQIKNTIEKEINNFDDLLLKGNYKPIQKWLIENIYQHGRIKTPVELLHEATGEGPNVTYLIKYLEKKYS